MKAAFAKAIRRKRPCWPALALALAVGAQRPAGANPTGGSVAQGAATFSASGSILTVGAANNTVINWQSFNIGAGETTAFVQPSASSVVWNRVNDVNPSQILGHLKANGIVVLQNPSGIYVGGGATLSAHGLILTTASTPPPNFSGGGPWSFDAPPPAAKIVNYGRIAVAGGGSVFLLADDIDNHGSIFAPRGEIGLYAGQKVLISTTPDGRGLSVETTVPAGGAVNNQGQLVADAGRIALTAQTVNQNGLIQANSVRDEKGVIELVAADQLNMGAKSEIQAHGDDFASGSGGGSVVLKSGNDFSDQAGGTISVAGGERGGDGGTIEISAPNLLSLHSILKAAALPGWSAGKLILDPYDIILDSSGFDSAGSGTVLAGNNPGGTLDLNVNSAFAGFSQITLQATHDIRLADGTDFALSDNTGVSSGQLTLEAGHNIIFGDQALIYDENNWSVTLKAGVTDFNSGTVQPGAGSIYLGGFDGLNPLGNSGSIQTAGGAINLTAGQDVLVGSGSVITTHGGSIEVTAMTGDVNTGTRDAGFNYSTFAPYYSPFQFGTFGLGNATTLGGISTAAGGDVTIQAGHDVTSYLPTGNDTSDAGAGAFGSQPGNVRINAGGSVYGHYVVVNGTGNITAGQDIGNAMQNVALSLVKGVWNLDAPNGNIYLQEVRNPNGVFNSINPSSSSYHLFNYDPQAAVNLTAGAGVYLTGQNLPRPGDAVIGGVNYLPILWPPTLTIAAGAGGITLENDMVLFPSPYGDLTINDAGDFSNGNAGGNPTTLLMSDSAQTRWFLAPSGSQPFSNGDHGSSPLELNNPNPVTIAIGGNMNDIILRMSKTTDLTVGGDMNGCSFYGQNLHPNDVTRITVAGRISNPGSFNFVSLSDPLSNVPAADLPLHTPGAWYEVLQLAVNPARLPGQSLLGVPVSQLESYLNGARAFPGLDPTAHLAYDPTTHTLTAIGPMPSDLLNALQQPTLTLVRYGPDGTPLLDAAGHFITDTITWTSGSDASQIAALYQASQTAPPLGNPSGAYVIGGPGEFDVHASSISLGNAYGILSLGNGQLVNANYAYLTSLLQTAPGATLHVSVTKDQTDQNGNLIEPSLAMTSSTIAALGGGDVYVTSAGGSMDLGSPALIQFEAQIMNNDHLGLGIYTTGGGNVTVTAQGTINVDSSRIATFNGGDIFVESLAGDVNAGSGSPVVVPVNVFSPYAPFLTQPFEFTFANGIVAQTLTDAALVPGSATLPGNITVVTPQGSIYASLGGILQEVLNGTLSSDRTITLIAGTAASDSSPGYTGNIDLGTAGVIGVNVSAKATGKISGLAVGQNNVQLNASSLGDLTAVGRTVDVRAGPSVGSGGAEPTVTIIGSEKVNYSGGTPANLSGPSVSANGSAAQSTFAPATATSAGQSAAATATDTAAQEVAGNTEEDQKKKKKHPLLERVKRVTVILSKVI